MVGIEPNTRNYTHRRRDNYSENERIDLTETVFYRTANKTKGKRFKGQFDLSDLITRFRLTVNGFSKEGTIGYNLSYF
jgi:hypothetical protein